MNYLQPILVFLFLTILPTAKAQTISLSDGYTKKLCLPLEDDTEFSVGINYSGFTCDTCTIQDYSGDIAVFDNGNQIQATTASGSLSFTVPGPIVEDRPIQIKFTNLEAYCGSTTCSKDDKTLTYTIKVVADSETGAGKPEISGQLQNNYNDVTIQGILVTYHYCINEEPIMDISTQGNCIEEYKISIFNSTSTGNYLTPEFETDFLPNFNEVINGMEVNFADLYAGFEDGEYYRLRVTVQNDKGSDNVSRHIQYHGSVITPSQTNYTVCQGDNVTLTASGNGTLTWKLGSTVLGTGNSYTVSNAQTSAVYTVTSSEDCVEPINIYLTVNPKPLISINSNIYFCEADMPYDFSNEVSVSPSGLGGGYNWPTTCGWANEDFDAFMTGNSCPPSSYPTSHGHTTSLTYTSADGCTSDAEVLGFTWNNTPEFNAVLTNPSCANMESPDGEMFFDPVGAGQIALNWNGLTTPENYNQNGYTFTGLDDTPYPVKVEDSHGCYSIQTFQLTEPTPPTISFSNVVDAECSENCITDIYGSVTLTWGGGNGGPYLLSSDGASTFFSLTGSSPSTFNGWPQGTEYLFIKDVNGCFGSSSTELTVGADNDLHFTQAPVVTNANCVGQYNGSIALDVSFNGTGSFLYQWTGSGQAGPMSQNQYSINALGASSTNYYITITENNSGCAFTDGPYNITAINSPITASITGAAQPSCNGVDDGELTGSQTGASLAGYSWSNNVFVSANPNLIEGTYTLTVTEENTNTSNIGCYATAQHTLLPASGERWQQYTGDQNSISDQIIAMETDDDDNVYVLGQFEDQTKIGTNTITVGAGASGTGAFIAKYDQCGNLIWTKWTTKAQYNEFDIEPIDIAIDNSEVVIVLAIGGAAGSIQINGSPQISVTSTSMVYYSLLNSNGNPSCSTLVSGVTSQDEIYDIEITGDNLYLAGQKNSNGKATVFEIDLSTCSNSATVFVNDLNTNSPNSEFTDIEFGSGNTMYVIGTAQTEINFTTGTSLTPMGSGDAFVARYYNTNSTPICSTQVITGDNVAASGVALALDDNGDVVICGNHQGTMSNFGNLSTNMNNAFVARLDASSLSMDWAHNLDEPSNEINSASATDVDVDGNGYVIVSGNFDGETARITTTNAMISAYGTENQSNVWIARMSDNSSGDILSMWSLDGSSQGASSATVSCGEINNYIGGVFNATMSFYPTSEADLAHPGNINQDAGYVVRFGTIYDELGRFYKSDEKDVMNDESLFSLYPNPTNDMTTLTWELDEMETDAKIAVRIMDVQGRLILNEVHSFSKGMLNLNLEHNPSGVYFVEIETGTTTWREKLIKH